MPRIGDFGKIYAVKTVSKLADAMDAVGLERYSNNLRGWSYLKQMKCLQDNIGQQVEVKSSSWGDARMAVSDEEGVGINYDMFNDNGLFVHHHGPLSKVVPYWHVFVDDLDAEGVKVGANGLPFMGMSVIREVRRSNGKIDEDGKLLYINPEVDEGFFGRYYKMTLPEKKYQQRRLFGKMEPPLPPENEQKISGE
jgi:hypothetical protein